MDQAKDKLTAVFRDVFKDPHIELDMHISPQDLPNWDSFRHVNLIIAIEEVFLVELSPKDVQNARSVASLVEILNEKGCGIGL